MVQFRDREIFQKTQLFEKVQIPSYSPNHLKSYLSINLNIAEAVLQSLEGVVSTDGYSKEFQNILLENMEDTPDNGGIFANIKLLERKIFTSGFAIRTAHRCAVAAELYTREKPSAATQYHGIRRRFW